MSYKDWLTTWYNPNEHDFIAYITVEKIAEVGGADLKVYVKGVDSNQINKGIVVLQKWCRLNCIQPGKPVSVMGRTGFAFLHQQDALLFKLTWG